MTRCRHASAEVALHPHDALGLARLRGAILGYLRAHPQAADTVAGIAEWWLPRHLPAEAVERVQAALDQLVAQGWVEKIVLVGGTVLYEDRAHHRSSLQ
jgi:Fe2+ or Zn2+ uptake regulation protein